MYALGLNLFDCTPKSTFLRCLFKWDDNTELWEVRGSNENAYCTRSDFISCFSLPKSVMGWETVLHVPMLPMFLWSIFVSPMASMEHILSTIKVGKMKWLLVPLNYKSLLVFFSRLICSVAITSANKIRIGRSASWWVLLRSNFLSILYVQHSRT